MGSSRNFLEECYWCEIDLSSKLKEMEKKGEIQGQRRRGGDRQGPIGCIKVEKSMGYTM